MTPNSHNTAREANPVSADGRPSVVVVGGGLAGIAASIALSSRGAAVTLVETSKRLGGRATSFVDAATGQVLDNCQHVLMGCCTNLIDLYRRLGVADHIRWHRRLYFADGRGRIDTLEADDLPAPLHMTRSLMAFRSLSLIEKAAIARGMLAIMRQGAADRDRLHNITFARWLDEHGQPPGAVSKFWSVVVTSALNESPQRVSAAYAVQVFQDGFLANEAAYVMGLPGVPLVQLYDTAHRVITEAGGRVMLAAGAEQFVFDGHRVTALRLTDGRELNADAFVSAVPFDRLARLCPDPILEADERLGVARHFTVSPIIGIHLWFETPGGRLLMDLPHLILMDSPLHWVFNKGRDPHLGGQHLHGVISAAYELVDTPAEQIVQLAVEEVRKVLRGSPHAAGARLLHARVIKEKRATFSAVPGTDELRPPARGAIENLCLAGDWCRTGWPATMEGAVRSGYLAAGAAADHLSVIGPCQGQTGRTHLGANCGLVADLPAGLLYRLCAAPAARP